MMQRRSTSSTTTTTSTSANSSNTTPKMTTPSLDPMMKTRRKVRRRRFYLNGSAVASLNDIQSLLLVAVLTCALTASIVWLGSKLYVMVLDHQRQLVDSGSATARHWHNHLVHRIVGKSLPADGDSAEDDYDVLPWNKIYHIPEAMETLGDRTDEYAQLRYKMDQILPVDDARSRGRIHDLTKAYPAIGAHIMGAHHSDQVREAYDIDNCPDTPPAGYPFEWKLVDEVLQNWPVAEMDQVPSKIHQGLCIFDYTKDYDKAVTYRKANLPFVVINDPRVARTVERWSIPGYLSEMLGKDVPHRTEYNTNSHFLYNMPTRKQRLRTKKRNRRNLGNNNNGLDDGNQEELEQFYDLQGRPATSQRQDLKPQAMRMTYDEWFQKANKTHVGMEEEHYYFRLIGCGYMSPEGDCDMGSSEYLYDEMPYFQPRNDNSNEIYLGNPKEQKGIHCRFGMKGVIAENHFDAGRNSIVVLGGRRRYILSHPRQCENLALFPRGHESARHSEVDYANPDVERFPEFADKALANEVVLEAGQVLYLPEFWFHYIVSLEVNYQCNTRSGNTDQYNSFIRDCGFPVGGVM